MIGKVYEIAAGWELVPGPSSGNSPTKGRGSYRSRVWAVSVAGERASERAESASPLATEKKERSRERERERELFVVDQ